MASLASKRKFVTVCTALSLFSGCAGLQPPTPQIDPETTSLHGDAQPTAEPVPDDSVSELEQTDDLWMYLRQNFRIKDVRHSAVDREVARWAKWPQTINESSERAVPFMYYVVAEVERRNLPAEFALIPFVESGFQLKARSHRSASGLWQIMPATGKRFGLTTTWWYDGRRDFVSSTHAAMDYLAFLFERFDNDPLLALAAYNAGEGRVDAARTRNRTQGRNVDFWSIDLPRETESYVPRLLALAEVLRQPSRYGVKLAPIGNQPALAMVDTGGQIELAVAAELAEISDKDVQLLNAGHRRWATGPDGPDYLLIPVQNAQALELGLAELPVADRLRWAHHRVVTGDTLWDISRQYGVNVEVLMQSNGMRGDRIRLGQNLLVPLHPDAVAPAGGTDDRDSTVYVVRTGDNLWNIARRFGVSHREIARWNDLHPQEVIRPGKRLLIWA